MISEGMIATKTANFAAKFKRHGLVDILFLVGVGLVIIGFTFLCLLESQPSVLPLIITIIILGIVFLVAGLTVFLVLLVKKPELLMPENAQINAKVATLLTDNISEKNKVEIAKALISPTTKQLGEL